jgi:hypothetical protein
MKLGPVALTIYLAPTSASAFVLVRPASTPMRNVFRKDRKLHFYSSTKDEALGDSGGSSEETQVNKQKKVFVNDGPLVWLSAYLTMFGVQEGKSQRFGVFASSVDEAKRTSPTESAMQRQKSAEELINIGDEERQLRDQAGTFMWALSAGYLTWASLFADDGGPIGHLLRLLSVFPIFLSVGFKLSAKKGL